MKKIIEIKNLNFSYKNNSVFENFNLNIFDQNTSIIGTSAAGKTTLAKILAGLHFSKDIKINNLELNKDNLTEIRKNVVVVLNDFSFVAETVYEELAFGMENLCLTKNQIKLRINKVNKLFNLKNIIEKSPNDLTKDEKTLIKILSFVLMKPKLIIIDDLINNLNNITKYKLIDYINEMKVNIVNITSNLEEVLFTDYIIVLNKGKIILEGKTNLVLNEEKILKRLGFSLPFIVDLSRQLISYELIQEVYYDVDKLVGELWK